MSIAIRTLRDGTQAYSIRTQLDGTSFGLDFSWNARGEYWVLIIKDASSNPLVRRVIRVGQPLLARFKDKRLPPGDLVAVDTTGKDQDPGLKDLGGRVQLVYLTAADIVTALSA